MCFPRLWGEVLFSEPGRCLGGDSAPTLEGESLLRPERGWKGGLLEEPEKIRGSKEGDGSSAACAVPGARPPASELEARGLTGVQA